MISVPTFVIFWWLQCAEVVVFIFGKLHIVGGCQLCCVSHYVTMDFRRYGIATRGRDSVLIIGQVLETQRSRRRPGTCKGDAMEMVPRLVRHSKLGLYVFSTGPFAAASRDLC